MFDGYELTQEIDNAIADTVSSIGEMEKYGKDKARLEATYNVLLAKKELEYRANNCPASMVKDLAKGDESVSAAYVEWQCAETMYSAAKENVMLHKRRADVARERIQREWAQTGMRAL